MYGGVLNAVSCWRGASSAILFHKPNPTDAYPSAVSLSSVKQSGRSLNRLRIQLCRLARQCIEFPALLSRAGRFQ